MNPGDTIWTWSYEAEPWVIGEFRVGTTVLISRGPKTSKVERCSATRYGATVSNHRVFPTEAAALENAREAMRDVLTGLHMRIRRLEEQVGT